MSEELMLASVAETVKRNAGEGLAAVVEGLSKIGHEPLPTLTIEEMYRRVRKHQRTTRNKVKAMVRKAQRDGLLRVIPGPGVVLELTEAGREKFASLVS